MKKYDIFILKSDLNPKITAGMIGVILEIYDNRDIIVEFVKDDGTNIEYQSQMTFMISKDLIKIVENPAQYNKDKKK